MSNETPVRLLSTTETCELLDLSMPTLRRMTKARRVPFVKIGARVLFEPDVLREWIAEHRVTVAQPADAAAQAGA